MCSRLTKKELFLLPGSLNTHNCDTLSHGGRFTSRKAPGWQVAASPPLLIRKWSWGVLGGPRLNPGAEQEPSIQPHPVFSFQQRVWWGGTITSCKLVSFKRHWGVCASGNPGENSFINCLSKYLSHASFIHRTVRPFET